MLVTTRETIKDETKRLAIELEILSDTVDQKSLETIQVKLNHVRNWLRTLVDIAERDKFQE